MKQLNTVRVLESIQVACLERRGWRRELRCGREGAGGEGGQRALEVFDLNQEANQPYSGAPHRAEGRAETPKPDKSVSRAAPVLGTSHLSLCDSSGPPR